MRFNDYVSGAKSCIELIAVYAANQELNMGNKSYLRCFQRFITYLQQFDSLNIHFGMQEHQIWDKTRPRVVDPVNPYNNLAKNWGRESIQLVKRYAGETNRRLSILAQMRVADLNQLFEPQPVYIPNMWETFGLKNAAWFIGIYANVSMLPDLKVRNERFHKDFELRNGLKFLMAYLQIVTCISKALRMNTTQTQEAVQKMLSKQVFNNPNPNWKPAVNVSHEDFDVTFTIPLTEQKAIQVSCRLYV